MAHPTSTNSKLTIAIAGCGIGGLTLGAFLSKFSAENGTDIQVDIYESKPEVSTLGAGVGIWKHSWEVLQELGVEEDVIQRGFKVPKEGEAHGPIFRKSDQFTDGYDFHNHIMPYGPLGLPRPVLLDILRNQLSDRCTIHTSKRLTHYTSDAEGGVTLHFHDNSTARANVLVGADGVHSKTRGCMFSTLSQTQSKDFEKYIEPMWTGTFAYRGSLAKATFAEMYPDHIALNHPRSWCGKNKHVITHPLGPNIGVICYTSRPELEDTKFTESMIAEVSIQEVADLFRNWEPTLIPLIQAMQTPNRWAIHVVRPLPFYVSGQVVLIGDAAHGMTPHQGVGGGQAIEDAYLLARILTYEAASESKLSASLKVYDEIRRPLSQRAAEFSRNNGMMYEYNHPNFSFNSAEHPEGPSREELEEMGKELGRSFLWLAEGHVQDDWVKAREMLQAQV